MHKEVKSMQKLVLGMVAVICLDIGFAAYMSTVDSGGTGLATLADAGYDTKPSDNVVVERIPSAVAADATLAKRLVIRRAAVDGRPLVNKTVYRKERVVPTQAAFRPSTTTIYYLARPRTEYPAATQAVYTQNGRRRTEKRSLIAAVLPVIKKPYDLLKAIGSKVF